MADEPYASVPNRHTKIVVDGFTSQEYAINTGIPQGSPLSPILYLFYNADFIDECNREANTTSTGYIDDTAILAWGNTAAETCSTLSRVLEKAHLLPIEQQIWKHNADVITRLLSSKHMAYILNLQSQFHPSSPHFGDTAQRPTIDKSADKARSRHDREHEKDQSLSIYTDGSGIEGEIGAAAVCIFLRMRIACKVSSRQTGALTLF
ncbi:hypothetical protein BM1_10920 [Bipolaris maydis]|nr:hypothetical protein BM1_10920 [Bipolaris maydis]